VTWLFFLTHQNLFLSSLIYIQGSNATGDCCSKCWNDAKNKEGGAAVASSPVCQPVASSSPTPKLEAVVEQPTTTTSTTKPMDIVEEKPTVDDTAVVEKKSDAMEVESETKPSSEVVTTETKPKKKKSKKKKGYKNLIAGMMEGNEDRVKSEEKDNIKNVTGGGAFVKIDKI